MSEESILKHVKSMIALNPDDDYFDSNIIPLINSAFITLMQIQNGKEMPFAIYDDSKTWEEYQAKSGISDATLAFVKIYIPIRVRLLFDPPQTQALLKALQEEKMELEFRIGIESEV